MCINLLKGSLSANQVQLMLVLLSGLICTSSGPDTTTLGVLLCPQAGLPARSLPLQVPGQHSHAALGLKLAGLLLEYSQHELRFAGRRLQTYSQEVIVSKPIASQRCVNEFATLELLALELLAKHSWACNYLPKPHQMAVLRSFSQGQGNNSRYPMLQFTSFQMDKSWEPNVS